jgi:hypothetical protein
MIEGVKNRGASPLADDGVVMPLFDPKTWS